MSQNSSMSYKKNQMFKCHEKALFLFIEITECSFLKYLAKTDITIPGRKWTTNVYVHDQTGSGISLNNELSSLEDI